MRPEDEQHAPSKAGRKRLCESRAFEIRSKLQEWRLTPAAEKTSLRALAIEMGTSHQLLAFYLRRQGLWESEQYGGMVQQICDRASAERRQISNDERARIYTYTRAATSSLADFAVADNLRKLRAVSREGRPLHRVHVRMAKLLVRTGCEEALDILKLDLERKNNLPPGPGRAAKSFKTTMGDSGNSAKA
jgi:hypothetical protein